MAEVSSFFVLTLSLTAIVQDRHSIHINMKFCLDVTHRLFENISMHEHVAFLPLTGGWRHIPQVLRVLLQSRYFVIFFPRMILPYPAVEVTVGWYREVKEC